MNTKAMEKLRKRFPALFAGIELDKALNTFPVCTLVAALLTLFL